MLNSETFKTIVESTPLVAVDFVITDSQDSILLGLRSKPPAKGMWCVPGGRVLKNESLMSAVKRKLHEEIGLEEIPPMRFWEFMNTFTLIVPLIQGCRHTI